MYVWIVHLTPNKNPPAGPRCSTQTVHTIKTHQFLAQLSDVLTSINGLRWRPGEFIRNSNVIGPTWPTFYSKRVVLLDEANVKEWNIAVEGFEHKPVRSFWDPTVKHGQTTFFFPHDSKDTANIRPLLVYIYICSSKMLWSTVTII